MSYTRKVTYYKTSGCGSTQQHSVTTTFTQQSSNGFTSSGWVQVPHQQQQHQQQSPAVVWQTVQPTTQQPHQPIVTNSTGGGGGGGSSSTPFDAAVLEEHNRLRAKHSAAPLTLDPAISQYAQEWANNIASRNVMQHRSNNRYGENIYACFGKTNLTGQEVVHSWYNEIKDYRFGESNPSNFGKVGHFTQVVWKNSKRLGVGMAKNGNNVYVVCNYDPPGNFGGQYPANVTRS